MIEGLILAPDEVLGNIKLGSAYTHMQARVRAGLTGGGYVWLDREFAPCVGVLVSGMAFPLGEASHPLAAKITRDMPPMLSVVPPNEAWLSLIKSQWGRLFAAKTYWHFAPMPKPAGCHSVQSPPLNCKIEQIDQDLFAQLEDMQTELTDGYPDFETFAAQSNGYCGIVNDEIVCAAILVASHEGMGEISVYCVPKFRRRGIALSVCTTMLRECQIQGMEIYWEAENPASCQLARKLGFSTAHTYSVCRRLLSEDK